MPGATVSIAGPDAELRIRDGSRVIRLGTHRIREELITMQTALVVTWTHPVVGREQKALAYAAEVAEFWNKQAAEGKCSAPQMFMSEAGTGIWLVTGDRQTLLSIHDTEEARLLTMKGELLLESFKLEIFYAGDAAADYLVTYGSALEAIA